MNIVPLAENDEPARRDLDGVVGPDLFERASRPLGDRDVRILAEEDVALRSGQGEAQGAASPIQRIFACVSAGST